MRFTAITFRDEDGYWCAFIASMPGVVGQGDTEDEAIADVREGLSFTLESMAERGESLPAGADTPISELVPIDPSNPEVITNTNRRFIDLPQAV